MPSLITISTHRSRLEAEIVRGLLASKGIDSFIVADDAGSMRPFPMSYSMGVELKVKAADYKKARKILG